MSIESRPHNVEFAREVEASVDVDYLCDLMQELGEVGNGQAHNRGVLEDIRWARGFVQARIERLRAHKGVEACNRA